jgi:mannose-1-phosphate guanylyltransferase
VKKGNQWSIILAGGEGERIRPLIQQCLGHHKPKQYCTFVGHRSMFQRTLDRADRKSLPEHRVTISYHPQSGWFDEGPPEGPLGNVRG